MQSPSGRDVDPENSATLVRYDAKGRRVEYGTVAWATGVGIARGSGDWYVFNVVKITEDGANGAPYRGTVRDEPRRVLLEGRGRHRQVGPPRRYISREFLTA